MGKASEVEQVAAQSVTDTMTPDIPEQDDMLGASAPSPTEPEQPLPSYNAAGHQHLETIRQALEDRAKYDRPEDSIWFVPPPDPLVNSIDQLPRPASYRLSWDVTLTSPTHHQYALIDAFFRSIESNSTTIIQQLLHSRLLTANTPGVWMYNGITPLVHAVRFKQKHIMITLLENGALINGWSGMPHAPYNQDNQALRTPLMVAASQGDLPTVKWLMEGYGADDSIIAPDGQIALRLAADNGHGHVVAYLPVRRGGMYIRWSNKQAKLLKRIKRLFTNAWWFIRGALYDVPHFLVRELLVNPVRRSVRWCWKNKHFFVPFVKRKVKEFPEKIKRLVKEMGEWLRKLPERMKIVVKEVWKMLREVPGAIKRLVMRIPGAMRIAWKAIKDTAGAAWDGVKHIFERVFSFLHTAIMAIVTFFQNVTFANLMAAMGELLEAVFVTFPIKMLHLLEKSWEVMCKILDYFFKYAGEVLWCIGYALFHIVIYLPEQILKVVGALGEMIAASWKEARVWWNPKAI